MPDCRSACQLSILIVLTVIRPLVAQQPDDLDGLQAHAVKAAVAKVAPCVVQIETSGGTDLIGSGPQGPQLRKGVGPTSGVVVAADGYLITSAFNFANKPSAIFVGVPGRNERFVAKVVATDHTRMLTLLKIDAAGLPVPAAASKGEMKVGQWSIAVGRALTAHDGPPSVSVGILSALGRIWGKAVQTDAKVSPVNYGGPLVDIRGRVIGVLVPASPRGEDETAGVEWYDSGIGFAVPLEDINAVLPRLKSGNDLRRGVLGVRFQSTDIYGPEPTIGTVSPDSAAAKAGVKPGDTITEFNGKPVARQNQLMHLLGDKYEGDVVTLKLRRGKDDVTLKNVKLTGDTTTFVQPFVGILPVRDDAEPGVEVRYVFPKSPAETVGVKAGDRITKVGVAEAPPRPLPGMDELAMLLARVPAGSEIRLEVQRKADKKTETLKVRLGVMNDTVPDELPEPATRKQALTPRKPARPGMPMPKKEGDPKEEKKEAKKADEKKEEPKKDDKQKPQTGLHKRTNTVGDREYWVYAPDDYDPNVSYALVLWLHPAGKGSEKDIASVVEAWQDDCQEQHLLFVAPTSENEAGWLASESDAVLQIVAEVMGQYTVDRRRVVAHGMGLGGQFAYYLAFLARDLIRGVATTGAPFTGQARDNVAEQRLAFFIAVGAKDPLLQAIAAGKDKLAEKKFPVTYREIAGLSNQYLDADTLDELVRWIDSLDRQ